jgi:hypothetical protein
MQSEVHQHNDIQGHDEAHGGVEPGDVGVIRWTSVVLYQQQEDAVEPTSNSIDVMLCFVSWFSNGEFKSFRTIYRNSKRSE